MLKSLVNAWITPVVILLAAVGLIFSGYAYFIGQQQSSVSLVSPVEIEVIEPEEVDVAVQAAPPELIVLTFLGDMMFDRHIRTKAEESGYDFILAGIKDHLADSDLVIGNLEAPITTAKSISQGSVVGSPANFTFTTDPAILEPLSEFPFIANLGNNHILNFYADGVAQTEKYLEEAQIPFFGQTGEETPSYLVKDAKGMSLAFINYNQFVPGGEAQVFSDLEELSQTTDLQIIYTHWGIEYEPEARPVVVDLAHRLVDAGADLIIGTHPHVIQNSEIYRGAPIYYSLGNTIFDQYFSAEVRTGLIVTVSIDPLTKEMEIREQSTWLDISGQTQLLSEE